ncbi:unnamed protein product, partial [Didymodactylos carnosus]
MIKGSGVRDKIWIGVRKDKKADF